MITALISAAFGALNALLPDLMGFFKKKQDMEERQRERAHELAMLDKTADIQVRLGQQRLEEARVTSDLAAIQTELAGFYTQLKAIYAQQAPLGVKWVDAWNACLRPAAVTLILVVFAIGIVIYEVSILVLWWKGMIPGGDMINAMFTGLVGEAIQAVLGYLFGYRGTNAARAYVARH